MDSVYIPISCTYYDRLEAWAVRRTVVDIHYRHNDGETEERISGIIVDLFSRDNAEYLELNSGEKIRLDQLISVNNIPLPKDNTCNQ